MMRRIYLCGLCRQRFAYGASVSSDDPSRFYGDESNQQATHSCDRNGSLGIGQLVGTVHVDLADAWIHWWQRILECAYPGVS